MTNVQKDLLAITTIFQARNELPSGVISLDHDRVHLSESYFLELFSSKTFEVSNLNTLASGYKYEYTAQAFGVTFITISKEKPNHTYPVEELAADLIEQWESQNYPDRRAIYYVDGSYRLQTISVMQNEIPIYTAGQHTSEESISLETAILDHMEGQHHAE